jgi:hypothetical protein
MSEELNIANTVMDQIHTGKIKMRPKLYFIVGSLLTFAGLVSSIVVSVFFVGLIRFSLRTHGPMGGYRLDQILSSIPWWVPLFACASLGIGIWLLRTYDFSFKMNTTVVIVIFVAAVVVGGWIMDSSGLNDLLLRQGPMRGVMHQYLKQPPLPGTQSGFGRGPVGR